MIRKMTESDRAQYFEMSKSFYSSGAAHYKIEDEKRNKFWKFIVEGVFVNGYVLECENKVAGYALTVNYYSQEFGGKVFWIDELFVKPEFRGRNLGTEFLEYVKSLDGNVLLRLEAEKNNQKAIALYKRLGFEELDYLQLIKKI